MPFLSSFEVENGKIWGFFETKEQRRMYDTFARAATTAPSLGISTDGEPWSTLKGSWYVNSSSQAECDDAASNYSLATYDLNTTQQLVYGNLTPGMGIIFNGIDANNWWGATYTYTSSAYSCNCVNVSCNCSSVQSCADCGGTNYSGCSMCGSTCNTCYVGSVLVTSCTSCGSSCISSCTLCNTCQVCQTCQSCSTCYTYTMTLSVLNSINGTVYTVASAAFATQTDFNLAVQVSGTTATLNGYQTTIAGTPTLLSQITNAIVYTGNVTITGTQGTLTGMFKSPGGNVSQGAIETTFYGTGIQF